MKLFTDWGFSTNSWQGQRGEYWVLAQAMGIYGYVRQPLYSGLIAGAFSWALYEVSLSHLIATIILLVFFNAKANREEQWLLQNTLTTLTISSV